MNTDITIQLSTPDQVKDFEIPAWAAADRDHYGKETTWESWAGEKFLFAAKQEGHIVGVVAGKLTAGVVYIERLISHPDKRGLGIGTQLMQQAETWARDHGAHLIYLDTGKDWDANHLYQKLGYTITSEIPDYYYHQDFVIYTKSLK